ncbi:glyceraldehyde-3-phosphate dehydrogenase 1 [Metarhizium rileyi]|uniref:Glyceraldehyde-3-phosphate dehydrogenase 1 n=1 Tax=Metarhizium rileyi (strain RCEF 4871) TaxID=1649241 RepID=A0A5C6FYA4_METRR|nr:glyceraldehyde-3-phosphate dehydrogenase 1 [Metarhizium rileyi]
MPRLLPGTRFGTRFESSLEMGEIGEDPFLDDERVYSQKRSKMRFLEDFKRNDSDRFFPGHHLSPANSRTYQTQPDYTGHLADLEKAQSGLARRLKGRHLQMIAISGSIGTGLFVTSGASLATSGPASLFLAFAIAGVSMYCTCQALGELAIVYPVAGSFSSWATRFVHPSWGFALGWNYALQWLVSFPVQVVAASEVIAFWRTSLPGALFVTLFIMFIVGINMLGVKVYGEAEFLFAIIKITAVIGLFGVLLNFIGTPEQGYIGFEYWRNPGAFENGFKGFSTVLLNATFAFSGTELIGLAAAETTNPRKSLPMAIKQVFWRICLFYLSIILLIGLVVKHNDPRLTRGLNKADANASPLVIAFQEAGVQVLPSIINAVILISVLSVANSALFGSSRTLAALGALKQAPALLSYIDRKGRPLVAIAVAAFISLLAYVADLDDRHRVLEWLLFNSITEAAAINNRLIDLLSHCTSPEIDNDNHEEIVDEVLGIILDAGRAVFKKVAAPPKPFSAYAGRNSQSLLSPARLTFQFHETATGDATVVPIDPGEAYTNPSYDARCDSSDDGESDIDSILPCQNAMKIIVAETFVASAGHVAGRVEVDGEEMFCKAHGDGRSLTSSSVGRELASLHRIRNDSRLKNDTSTRIPHLLGYVHNDTGRIIGFLRQWVPGRRLKDVDIPATSAERRRKWAAQIRDTVHYLHGIELIWGDSKADNIIIDERDNAWLIDFGGGFTEGWVDEELADTLEGDMQAMRSIAKFLKLDDDTLT